MDIKKIIDTAKEKWELRFKHRLEDGKVITVEAGVVTAIETASEVEEAEGAELKEMTPVEGEIDDKVGFDARTDAEETGYLDEWLERMEQKVLEKEQMDIAKFLNGTEFENLIPKFHGEGITTLDDLRTLHRNGKMFELCKEITSTPIAALKLKKLIQSQLNKFRFLAKSFAGFSLCMVLLSLYFTFDELIGYVLSVYRAFIEWGDNVYLLITVLILFTAICVKPYMKVKKEEANQQRKKKKKQQNEEKMLSMMTLEERFKYINKKKDAANAKMYGEKAPKAPPKLPPIPKK